MEPTSILMTREQYIALFGTDVERAVEPRVVVYRKTDMKLTNLKDDRAGWLALKRQPRSPRS